LARSNNSHEDLTQLIETPAYLNPAQARDASRKPPEKFASLDRSSVAPSAALPGFIIGEHPLMQRINALITRVANTDATVLITGESGTGKEVVARAIHSLSQRVHRPFVPINCAAIPHELLESELFGHARGAFTGAHSARAGMFQLAEGGTIFLDEVGEIPLTLQPKLLRVLQCGEVRPVGSDQTTAIDVRVIAATNKDLAKELQAGTFREDLFYRLQVIPLHLPPLRSRRSDVPLLLAHFLEKTNRKYAASAIISEEASVYLWEYDWPGNVRELENVVERLVVLCENGQIGLNDLPANIASFVSEKKLPQPTLINNDMDFRSALKQFEQRLIDEALRLANGNKAMAARMLKIKRTTLVAKLHSRSTRKEDDEYPIMRITN
jgi:transcriptional regulator with GAF, ATPase, and Fis domain